VALAAAALSGVGASSAAVAPPTGDVDATLFYKQEASRYAALPGARIVSTGYFFGHPIGTAVRYMWGHSPAAGFFPQRATVLARLHDGQIVAYVATLTAPKMRRVRIVMEGSSVFVTSGKCWNKADAGSSPFGTGEMYLFNDGGAHFLPLVTNGGSKTTVFTYTWAEGARAREADTFSAGPRPTVKISIEVTGAQRMSIEKTITPLARAPELPVPSPPAVPVPKPLCGGAK
jgi:hypothetical protein